MIFEFFPESYIALNRELATDYHPTLAAKLSKHPVNEVDIRLAEIATHCDILLDGTYTLEERDHLCAILLGRLQVLRELPKAQIILQ